MELKFALYFFDQTFFIAALLAMQYEKGLVSLLTSFLNDCLPPPRVPAVTVGQPHYSIYFNRYFIY